MARTAPVTTNDPTPGPSIRRVDGPDGCLEVNGRTFSLSEMHAGTGISVSHISRVLNGDRNPSVDTLSAIAGFVGVTLEDLLAFLNQQ